LCNILECDASKTKTAKNAGQALMALRRGICTNLKAQCCSRKALAHE
jgi:hypothetical protein